MTLTNFLTGSAQLSGLLFIVTSMLAMGMSLTIPMIIQPLKNARRVIMALLAIGLLLGGREASVRSVMGFGTAQRMGARREAVMLVAQSAALAAK